jgi:methylenetetrahydrofolate--tRNA-(uracil-5-)-methyltransferase
VSWREPDVTVVGGGLAGSEAAWQLAVRGLRVALVEMKPAAMSPAHQTPLLCELVCSNSLRSNDPAAPAGLLKHELRRCGSMVIDAAMSARVPAGSALAVDRFGFGREVTRRLALHPNVRLERRLLDELPAGPTILATGPLTGGKLGALIQGELGGDRMYFYDAIAPIVAAESIDPDHVFRASRWDKNSDATGESEGDYLNCPMDRPTYEAFVAAIVAGRKVTPRAFEEPRYFESCLPIEVMAERGREVLAHGPMRPVGLTDPRTGRWPYAVVQLRPENTWGTAYNLVGFQTRLAYPEQARIFAMIPALARAEWLRFGSIHRNSYIDAPALLGASFELKTRPALRFAGLLTGVEGYVESCAMGLLVAWLTAGALAGTPLPPPPLTTMLGALYDHVTRARGPKDKFVPTNVNFGLLPPLPGVRKDRRKVRMAERAIAELGPWLAQAAPPGGDHRAAADAGFPEVA